VAPLDVCHPVTVSFEDKDFLPLPRCGGLGPTCAMLCTMCKPCIDAHRGIAAATRDQRRRCAIGVREARHAAHAVDPACVRLERCLQRTSIWMHTAAMRECMLPS